MKQFIAEIEEGTKINHLRIRYSNMSISDLMVLREKLSIEITDRLNVKKESVPSKKKGKKK